MCIFIFIFILISIFIFIFIFIFFFLAAALLSLLLHRCCSRPLVVLGVAVGVGVEVVVGRKGGGGLHDGAPDRTDPLVLFLKNMSESEIV